MNASVSDRASATPVAVRGFPRRFRSTSATANPWTRKKSVWYPCTRPTAAAKTYSWTPSATGYADVFYNGASLAGNATLFVRATSCDVPGTCTTGSAGDNGGACCNVTKWQKIPVTSGTTYYPQVDGDLNNLGALPTNGSYSLTVTPPDKMACDSSQVTSIGPGTSGVAFSVSSTTNRATNSPHGTLQVNACNTNSWNGREKNGRVIHP